ncbi:TPA: hypothetical protein ACS5OU_002211, partial [Escherichia coli]
TILLVGEQHWRNAL